jgi:cysteine synthase
VSETLKKHNQAIQIIGVQPEDGAKIAGIRRWPKAYLPKIFDFLDLSVGVITSDMLPENKKVAYECDIVYATNNELGFDYLRDNIKSQNNRLPLQR